MCANERFESAPILAIADDGQAHPWGFFEDPMEELDSALRGELVEPRVENEARLACDLIYVAPGAETSWKIVYTFYQTAAR